MALKANCSHGRVLRAQSVVEITTYVPIVSISRRQLARLENTSRAWNKKTDGIIPHTSRVLLRITARGRMHRGPSKLYYVTRQNKPLTNVTKELRLRNRPSVIYDLPADTMDRSLQEESSNPKLISRNSARNYTRREATSSISGRRRGDERVEGDRSTSIVIKSGCSPGKFSPRFSSDRRCHPCNEESLRRSVSTRGDYTAKCCRRVWRMSNIGEKKRDRGCFVFPTC